MPYRIKADHQIIGGAVVTSLAAVLSLAGWMWFEKDFADRGLSLSHVAMFAAWAAVVVIMWGFWRKSRELKREVGTLKEIIDKDPIVEHARASLRQWADVIMETANTKVDHIILAKKLYDWIRPATITMLGQARASELDQSWQSVLGSAHYTLPDGTRIEGFIHQDDQVRPFCEICARWFMEQAESLTIYTIDQVYYNQKRMDAGNK